MLKNPQEKNKHCQCHGCHHCVPHKKTFFVVKPTLLKQNTNQKKFCASDYTNYGSNYRQWGDYGLHLFQASLDGVIMKQGISSWHHLASLANRLPPRSKTDQPRRGCCTELHTMGQNFIEWSIKGIHVAHLTNLQTKPCKEPFWGFGLSWY